MKVEIDESAFDIAAITQLPDTINLHCTVEKKTLFWLS
jgi:hypothetical protein